MSTITLPEILAETRKHPVEQVYDAVMASLEGEEYQHVQKYASQFSNAPSQRNIDTILDIVSDVEPAALVEIHKAVSGLRSLGSERG